MEFNIKVTPEHVNTIFAGLDELPHKVSRRTLDHILQQVQAQEAAAQLAPAPNNKATPETPDAGLTD